MSVSVSRTRLVQVAPRVYAVLGAGAMPNAVCVDGGPDGVVVIDSRFTPVYAAEMMSELRKITSAPVTVLVNTHFHADHIFGNQSIPTSRIVAHTRTREILGDRAALMPDVIRKNRPDLAPELEDLHVILPNETVDDELELVLDGLRLEIEYAGHTAHTPGDLIVRIPEHGVLVAADLVFNGIVPVMRDGDLHGLAAALRDLRSDVSVRVIPGHGEIGDHGLIETQLAFVESFIELVERGLREGRTVEQVEADAKTRYASLMLADQRVGEGVRLLAAARAS